MHSQRLNLAPLNVWIVVCKEGEILCAHCDCVAGLAEACSHVGATLFAVEDAVRNYDSTSVTDTKAYWMPPSTTLGAPARVSEVNYSLHLLEEKVDSTEESSEDDELWEPSEDDKKQFLDELFSLERPSAVLTMFQPYADKLNEEATRKTVRGLLENIYTEENSKLSLSELICLGQTIDCSVDVNEVETLTRKQSKSKSWFSYRAGRITASNFKSVCHTKIESPSVSLLKRICYPSETKFKSVYTQYGCEHEKKALNDFVSNFLKCSHLNLKVWNVGLIIDINNPIFGASPDLMVSCDCCGKGCIEIKCPYCVKEDTIEEIVNFKQSFLKPLETENVASNTQLPHSLHLDNNHAYYYQVQMQMAVTNTSYCYFVAWTKKNIFYEKIEFRNEFFAEKKAKAMLFHEQVVMPELLGKYFTKRKSNVHTQPSTQPSTDLAAIPSSSKAVVVNEETSMVHEEALWCNCKMPEGQRKMIMCNNYFCDIKWFHMDCIKLKSVPKKSWYCKKCETVNINKKK